MEKSINPKYQEIASYTIAHKAVMKKNSLERTTAIDEHWEGLPKIIDIIIEKLNSDGWNELQASFTPEQAGIENHIVQTYSDLEKITDCKK